MDACKSGLGAVLLQDGSPVAYASRALTEAECRYAQIEKELLAVVFACERFHQYIYAKKTTVETDHQPLVSIITKPLDNTPARLHCSLDLLMIHRPRETVLAVAWRARQLGKYIVVS